MSNNENSISDKSTEITSFDPLIPDILIVKGKFKFQSASIYGVFTVLFDEEKKEALELHIYSSYFSDLYTMDIKIPWSILEKKFNKLGISGEFASSITNLFKHAFTEYLFKGLDITESIINDFNDNKTDKIFTSIEHIFNHVQKDRHIIMELSFEEEFSKEIESIKNLRIHEEQPKTDDPILNTPLIQVNPLDLNIPAHPILSPISQGILSQNIIPGAKLLMKIDLSTDYGHQWVKNFNAYNKETGTSSPIIATVEQVGPIIKNTIDILVKYNPNQYTKFNIESGVKLKIFDSMSTEPVINPIVYSDNIYQKSMSWDALFSDSSFKKLVIIMLTLTIIAVLALFFI